MNLSEYQKKAQVTALYPDAGNNPYYAVLGLTGEAGEIANTVKKIMRDDDGVITDEKRAEVKKELGDVLWYVACTATEMGLNLDEIAQANLDKLASRAERGVLKGSGNDR
ncbi:MAG: nucleoside triphosphate pyrophosphohydrolase family protein [bacterium]|jgi:NTP pyrophosphatase (non-canonical NTP hydrolase)|nr:nucleoside triphosphate pyrophosphohydrolase family protein [bacterium]